MTRYSVRHVTTYQYTEPVSLCQNLAHLAIRPAEHQQSELTALTISPEPAVIEERLDYFGNRVHYFTVQEPHRELKVEAAHTVTVLPREAPKSSLPWEAVRDRLLHDRRADWLEAAQFVFASRLVPTDAKFASLAAASFSTNRPILEAALDLVHRIHSEFAYDPQATTVATPVAEVFEHRRGVCQDFAHVLLAALRSLGLAARYVSGYLATEPPPGRPRLIGADAGHAWVSIFCGDAGWVDLDPTNDVIPDDRHILVAWGRDYEDVSPVKGVILGGGKHTVHVAVDVIPREWSTSTDVHQVTG